MPSYWPYKPLSEFRSRLPANSTSAFPHHYHAFGARIASAIPLPQLPTANHARQAVHSIDLLWDGSQTESSSSDFKLAGYAHSEPHSELRWTLPGVVELTLKRQSTNAVSCHSRGDPKLVAHFLLRSGIRPALSMLGVGYLHASAVAWQGRAIAIAGPSTSGKSVTAAALLDCGAALLSDHGAAYALAEYEPICIEPGTLAHQLHADSMQPVTGTPKAAHALPGRSRFRIDAVRCGSEAVPLGAVIVPTYAPQTRSSQFVRLRGADCLRAMLSTGAGQSGAQDSAMLFRQLPQIPTYALERPMLPVGTNLRSSLRPCVAEWLALLNQPSALDSSRPAHG